MKKKKKFKPLSNTDYKHITYALLVVIIILFVNSVYEDYLFNKNLPPELRQVPFDEKICSEIRGTPAWVQHGDIIGYGYQTFGNKSLQVVPTFINQSIMFVYHPDCYYCQEQIKYFGTDWELYQDSGLTINCEEVKKEND
jgi:hypothetical protein